MSTPTHNLGLTAVALVKELFLNSFTGPLNPAAVSFALDVNRSQLVITPSAVIGDAIVSDFSGVYRFSYVKADLEQVIPHPIAVLVANYPMTYRQLRNQLMARYGFLLEQKEFALAVDGASLEDDSNITTPLKNQYGQLTLYATDDSGRFLKNTSFSLIVLQPNLRVPLRALLDVIVPDTLSVLTGA